MECRHEWVYRVISSNGEVIAFDGNEIFYCFFCGKCGEEADPNDIMTMLNEREWREKVLATIARQDEEIEYRYRGDRPLFIPDVDQPEEGL